LSNPNPPQPDQPAVPDQQPGGWPHQAYPAGQYPPPGYPQVGYPSQPGTHPTPSAPYGQAGYYAQQPPAPKKSRKWPWIVGGVVALFLAVGLLGGGDKEKAQAGSSSPTSNAAAPLAQAAPAQPSPPAESAAPMNTPVRDGKFEFVVTGVQTGLTKAGDNMFLDTTPQGQFVVVSMKVTNIGNEPQGFSPSVQKLTDAQGREFENDTSAQIALGGSDIPVWDKVNPGNTVDVKVIYDMPTDAVPASIELHDSVFSGGEMVALTP
jgi:hypothetical protein